MSNSINTNEMTLTAMAQAYNEMVAALEAKGITEFTSVKRFADKKAGAKRLEAIIERSAELLKETMTEKAEAKKARSPEAKQSISDGVRASWENPEVVAKRRQRHWVEVSDGAGTQVFRSVRQAFLELGLPISKHIKFRMALKAAGKMEGYGYEWEAHADE